MAFDQSTITSILPPSWNGADLTIRWTSTSPQGTLYQCYIDGKKVYTGTNKFCAITMPASTISIGVCTVAPGEGTTNFSSSFPATPQDTVTLNWFGGTFQSLDIAGFFVFMSNVPGGPVDFGNAVANINAYVGPPTDGWNLGPWNVGAWGLSAASYTYTSPPLSSGVWSFAVVPYDNAGNEGAEVVVEQTISAPPLPPSAFADMTRLKYTFSQASETATLTWNASPSAN
jgi:hypothetical protein